MDRATTTTGQSEERDVRTKFASMFVKGLVVKQPTQEDDVNIHKLNMEIIDELKPALIELLVQPKLYPEIFVNRTEANALEYHFGMTIKRMLDVLRKTYKEGNCPAAIKLASDYFDGKVGPQALDEFKQYCLPITDRWVPMPLKGDPEYLGDKSAKDVITQISKNAPFLKHLGLPLLWDGDNAKYPALPLSIKQFVVNTLKRLTYLCSFYHQSLVMPQLAWASYKFVVFGMGTQLGFEIAEKVVSDSDVGYDSAKKYSSMELVAMLMPKINEISSTPQVSEAKNKVLVMLSVDAFMTEATALIKNVVERTNSKKAAKGEPPVGGETVQRILGEIKRHVTELLF